MPVTAGQLHTNTLRPATTLHRRIAILTTVIFLWLCSGATLTHTETCFDCFPVSQHAPHNFATAGPGSLAGLLPCAACEWNAITAVTPVVFVLTLAFFFIQASRRVGSTDTVRFLTTFASLRAPPCLL